MGRPVIQHALLLLQCMLVLCPCGVASRRGPVLLPESPCHKTEHPLIPHSEMEPWIFRFKAEGTVDYSQLTFDPGQNELIVGARNHLFRLNLEDLTLIQNERRDSTEPITPSPPRSIPRKRMGPGNPCQCLGQIKDDLCIKSLVCI